MEILRPASAEELAECLHQSADAGEKIELLGNGSKQRAGGAIGVPDVRISTAALDQVLQYEPRDLTVSAGAGMPFTRFRDMLSKDGYMVPLDPPFAQEATLGGIIAANSSGPRRRMFGTARDLVIGMKFATVEGKLVQSGGMVVKNVAGLDMGKLLIGSLGTLAAIAVLNFKLIPKPPGSRTFVFSYSDAAQALAERDRVLQSVLLAAAIDLLSPQAAAGCGRSGWLLAIGVNGNAKVLDRYQKEFAGAEMLEGDAERRFWEFVEQFPARFLEQHAEGAIVRHSFMLQELKETIGKLGACVIARAGNGVCYSFHDELSRAAGVLNIGKALMEFGPSNRAPGLTMWPQLDSGFPMMQRIKAMFDPRNLLNPGRLYGRL